jgi:hypothetical protein
MLPLSSKGRASPLEKSRRMRGSVARAPPPPPFTGSGKESVRILYHRYLHWRDAEAFAVAGADPAGDGQIQRLEGIWPIDPLHWISSPPLLHFADGRLRTRVSRSVRNREAHRLRWQRGNSQTGSLSPSRLAVIISTTIRFVK